MADTEDDARHQLAWLEQRVRELVRGVAGDHIKNNPGVDRQIIQARLFIDLDKSGQEDASWTVDELLSLFSMAVYLLAEAEFANTHIDGSRRIGRTK